MREIKMMFRLLRASAKSQVMYKADFVIGLIGTLSYNALFLMSIGIITGKFGSLGGFGVWEIILLYALFEIAHGLYGFFLQNMSSYLNRLVMDGTLDIYFTRPYGILSQLNGLKMNHNAFVDLFIGLVCFCAAAANAGIAWTIPKALMIPVFLISGAFVEFALSLVMNCGTVVSPNLRSLYGAYYQLVLISQRYPLHLFAHGFQAMLTFIFPLGFMNYYPVLFLTDRPLGWVGLFAPIVAALFSLMAVKVFHETLKHYSSTGN